MILDLILAAFVHGSPVVGLMVAAYWAGRAASAREDRREWEAANERLRSLSPGIEALRKRNGDLEAANELLQVELDRAKR